MAQFNKPPAPDWRSRKLVVEATRRIMSALWVEPVEAGDPRREWCAKARDVLTQISKVHDGDDVPPEVRHNASGVAIGIGNVGLHAFGMNVAYATLMHGNPEWAQIPADVVTAIVIPYRVLDAARMTEGVPKDIPEDVLQAFDAIWMANEWYAAYAYVENLITAGGWPSAAST